jgi:fructokinase
MKPLYGGIEAGGTKFICAVATDPQTLIAQVEIPTTSPRETIANIVAFFKAQSPIQAIGIGCFGPLDLDATSPSFGTIITSGKSDWNGTNIVAELKQALDVPINLDTDVNVAALGELRYGVGHDVSHVAYVTVGTGIGIGHATTKAIRSKPSEGGHMLIPRLAQDSAFKSVCSYHEHCLEGLASGTALQARTNTPGEQLAADNPSWELEATYIAYGITNLSYMMTPDRVVLGGGVMSHPYLLENVRAKVTQVMASYSVESSFLETIDTYLVAPQLNRLSGVIGALELARMAS